MNFHSFMRVVLSTVLLLTSIVGSGSAQLYTYQAPDNNVVESFSYNALSQDFTANFNFPNQTDSFWLVVNDGPDPSKTNDQIAILYGDLINNKITAYAYDGTSDRAWANSFKGGEYLAKFDNITSDGFTINVADLNTALNSPNWEGTRFDEKIGVWMHSYQNSDFEYDEYNQIIAYNHDHRNGNYTGGLDVANQNAVYAELPTPVNEPAYALLVILTALGGFSMFHKKRSV